MPKTADFKPDWVAPPGTTIVDALNERGLSITSLLKELELGQQEFHELVSGAREIDESLAQKISSSLGGTPDFWLARDRTYRLSTVDEKAAWLGQLPVTSMIELGWIPRSRDPQQVYQSCIEFFAVSGIAEWRRKYGSQQNLGSFRASHRVPMELGAVTAWLRKGEIAALALRCEPWDASVLTTHLPQMRSLTREKSPSRFLPALEILCGKSGVALTFAPTPPKCPVSGAARFISASKAWIHLSFRYLSDDHFWFTFFHEIGHLLLHPKGEFVEADERVDSREEQEANRFAADLLIPPQRRSEMVGTAPDYEQIIRFARSIGVSPGVVVGQLQHMGVLSPRQKNFLKRRYAWT